MGKLGSVTSELYNGSRTLLNIYNELLIVLQKTPHYNGYSGKRFELFCYNHLAEVKMYGVAWV